MKKTFFLVVLVFVLAVTVNAQNKDVKPKFGVGATLGLPVGDMKDFSNVVWGVDLQGEFPVAQSFNVVVNAGYENFIKKSGISGDSWGLIPILAGGKYFITDQLYGSLQGGISFATQSGGGSAFTWVPALGMKISDKVDVAVKYQSSTKDNTNTAFIGLRLGVSF
jgi:hypothetical protein